MLTIHSLKNVGAVVRHKAQPQAPKSYSIVIPTDLNAFIQASLFAQSNPKLYFKGFSSLSAAYFNRYSVSAISISKSTYLNFALLMSLLINSPLGSASTLCALCGAQLQGSTTSVFMKGDRKRTSRPIVPLFKTRYLLYTNGGWKCTFTTKDKKKIIKNNSKDRL